MPPLNAQCTAMSCVDLKKCTVTWAWMPRVARCQTCALALMGQWIAGVILAMPLAQLFAEKMSRFVELDPIPGLVAKCLDIASQPWIPPLNAQCTVMSCVDLKKCTVTWAWMPRVARCQTCALAPMGQWIAGVILAMLLAQLFAEKMNRFVELDPIPGLVAKCLVGVNQLWIP